MSGANAVPDITLDELERLIRLLGLLGSAHDGEALSAARFAQKWVVEHQTDWRTLLTPPAEPGVVAVVAPVDPDEIEEAHQRDRAESYRNGYQAGLAAMAVQVKAQAHMGQQPPHTNSNWTRGFSTMAGTGLGASGSPVHGTGGLPGANQGPAAQGPPAGSGGPQRAYPAGTWQAVAQALLDRDAQGIPGVFRGGREAQFVSDVLSRGFPTLTSAQEDWLRSIASRNGLSW